MNGPATITGVMLWQVKVPLLEEWAASPEFGEHVLTDERALIRLWRLKQRPVDRVRQK